MHRHKLGCLLDEIFPLQLTTAKLGGSIVSIDIEITTSMGHIESTTGLLNFPVWDLLLPLA